jgi:hypothetical protein
MAAVVGNLVRDRIVEVLCAQALADHLGDVRDAELELWHLIGIQQPEREFDSAFQNFKATLERASIPLPYYLREGS